MEVKKHSGLGIASCITSIVSGVFTFLVMVILVLIKAYSPGIINDSPVGALIPDLCLLTFLGALFIAFALGIAGLIQGGRKKIFAIIGILLAVAIAVGTIVFVLIEEWLNA